MSKPDQPQTVPRRGAQHDALEVFLGDWNAEGLSFGGPAQGARNQRIEFSDDGERQTITWEWRPQDAWLPLCDRVATKL